MRWADNVVEQSNTTTTGAYQLGGVPASGEAPGAQTFVAGIGDAQTCYYYAKEVSGTAWERGIGTVTDAATDTLTRTTIHGSSNAGAAVDWTGKTLRVYCVNSAHALRRSTLDHAGLLDNATFTTSRSGNAETTHLKTAAGNDPSPDDPVRVGFANGSGGFDVLECTGALSFTFSSGSTGGAVSGLEFKTCVVLLNNAGTLAMGEAVRPSGIKDNSIVSTTAEGGTGTADSPRVIYSASALSNVRARVLGYKTYTLATAGTWNTAPSDILLTRAGMIEVWVKEVIYEKTLTANGTFDTSERWPNGIPSEYAEFSMSLSVRGADADTGDILGRLYINGDTTETNYRSVQTYRGGSTSSPTAGGDVTNTASVCGFPQASSTPANGFASIIVDGLLQNSSALKECAARGMDRFGTESSYNMAYAWQWGNTAAITRMQLKTSGISTNFITGSLCRIFGHKAVQVLV